MRYKYVVNVSTGKIYAARLDVDPHPKKVALVPINSPDGLPDAPNQVDFSAVADGPGSQVLHCRPVDAAWIRLRLTHGANYAVAPTGAPKVQRPPA